MADRQPWSIRSAAPADLPCVLAFWQAAAGPSSPTDNEIALETLLDRDPGSLLLAEGEGEIAGTLIAAWDGWRGSFYRLAVDPHWRRQGIATALVRAGERRLRDLGAVRMTAIVIGEAGAGTELWRALGYERQSERSRFIRMVEPREWS